MAQPSSSPKYESLLKQSEVKRKFGTNQCTFVALTESYAHKFNFFGLRGSDANLNFGSRLQEQLAWIEGRENVKNVVLDMCDAFKKFARDHFPNAEVVADKFHVLRLLTPALNVRRKEITGDQRTNPVRKLLLRNGHTLKYFERNALHAWLDQHEVIREVYFYKEALHRFYRTRGYNKASRALIKLTDQMALSELREIKTLRKTLIKWRSEILAYFKTGLTNGRTEGYNRLAKLYQYRAFGYRSFKN